MCERGSGGGAVLGLFVPKAADTCVEEVGVGRVGWSASVHPVSSADPPAASGFPPLSLREQWLTDQASVLETCLPWQELHFGILSLGYLTLEHLYGQHRGSGQGAEAIKSPCSFFLLLWCISAQTA